MIARRSSPSDSTFSLRGVAPAANWAVGSAGHPARSSPAHPAARASGTTWPRPGPNRVSAYAYPTAPFGNAPDTPPMVETGGEILYETELDEPAADLDRPPAGSAPARTWRTASWPAWTGAGSGQGVRAGVLAGAYPIVAKIVGESFFEGLAREYLRRFPSASGDLNEYGASLAQFVAAFPHTGDLPYLADVARMEWLAHRAHYAADAAEGPGLRLPPARALLPSRRPLARTREIHPDDHEGEFSVDLDAGPGVLDAWLGALGDASWRVRKAAVDCLVGRAGGASVISNACPNGMPAAVASRQKPAKSIAASSERTGTSTIRACVYAS